MQKQSDEEIEKLDAASKPLRDAALAWARERDLGSGQSWNRERQCWEIAIWGLGGPDILVEVREDGSLTVAARAGTRGQARTPRGLRIVLDRLASP